MQQADDVRNGADGVWIFKDADHLVFGGQVAPKFQKRWGHKANLTTTYGEVEFRPLASLDDLAALLGELQGHPSWCIINGHFVGHDAARIADCDVHTRAGFEGQPMYRAGLARKAASYWQDAPSRFLRFDLDEWQRPGVDGIADPEAAWSDAIGDHFPEALFDCDTVVELSGSFGAPGKPADSLRGHVWVMLDTPATLAQMRTFAVDMKRDLLCVDTGVYTPGHVMLTAAPNTDGQVDPLAGRRVLSLRGTQRSASLVLDVAPVARVDQVQADPWADAITAAGYARDPLIGGIMNARCPFAIAGEHGEHGDGSSTRSQYFAPNFRGYAKPAFKCFHSACEGRVSREYFAKFAQLGVSDINSTALFAASSGSAPGAGHTMPAAVPRLGADPFIHRDGQQAMFAGCVMVLTGGSGGTPVMLMPSGMVLVKSAFNAKFAGYLFPLGGPKARVTQYAWEAFEESQEVQFPKADSIGFRPDLPYQAIWTDEAGVTRVNSYRPAGKFSDGDPAPFVDLIRRMLPNGDDAVILTSYLAACVRYPGCKFTWAPVLQGTDGTGKGVIGSVMQTALGATYVATPSAKHLASNFNDWLDGKLLVFVRELPAGMSEDLLESLKPLITDGAGMAVEGKGKALRHTDVCANFLFNTNHRDGIRKSAKDRRYCMLFCAQQRADDLTRDGMTEVYFSDLAAWLNSGGREAAAGYLRGYLIPERFDPTKGATRAPVTTSTADAIEAGRDEATQMLADLIETAAPGFRDGWVSFGMLTRAADTMRRKPAQPQLVVALENMGYSRCPGLTDGRTNGVVMPDCAKPRLWVSGGTLRSLATLAPAAIAKAYEAAQTFR